ncbi:RNA polymerase III-inhibiting protein maf1 [Tieghemiomyces parasiticus]|uniref:RNA polymerase III-inhibiting protein maf1 n=1 Tax=Tieghemiomyces parasiticus TaxID=78921 RepID=A0A9W8AEY3_9FUNG|nr:RNA polymerase III-inhibiting protein maf1 [Tieghemiomyces parasiticus]
MKYLEVREFSTITQALNFETSGENKVSGRLEAYSCKSVAADKKLYKFFENKFQEDLLEAASLSPEQSLSHIISPFGPLTESSSRKVLFYLIATLNASFPDYDFRSIKPEQFTHEPDVTAVMNDINSTLFTAGNTSAIRRHNMWENVDANIHLGEASVYSFHPDDDANPFGENGSM